jgi:uncharacterized protein YmfQ (DUF2313 family)
MTMNHSPVAEEGNSEDFYWEVVANPQTNEIWYNGKDDCLYPIQFERPVPIPFVSSRRIAQYRYRLCMDESTKLIHYFKDNNVDDVLGVMRGIRLI